MRPDRGSRRRVVIGILVAVFLIALFGLAVYLIEKHGLLDEQFGDSGDWGKNGAEQFSLELNDREYVSSDDIDAYLVIGKDDPKEGEQGYNGEMADFLMLVLIDNTTQKYGFYQINRDTITYVDVLDEKGNSKGAMTQQICIAHWYGLDAEQRNSNTVAAARNLFGGLPIDGYYTISMSDMGLINNAIGGVVVDIEEDMTNVDPEFVKGTSILLKDDQAEKFVRARMAVGEGSNEERMRRQSQYMQKAYNLIMNQLRERPEYINDLYQELHEIVETDSGSKDLSNIADRMINFESEGIIKFSGESTTGQHLEDGVEHAEFYPDGQSIVDCLKKVMNLEPLSAE